MKISGFPTLKDVRGRSIGGSQPAGAAGGLRLAAGELVRGRVAGVTPEGKVLLSIGEVTVEARSEVALKTGGEFWFEVRQGGAEPWLTLADKKGAAQELLRQLAGGIPALTRLLPQLAVLLQEGETLAPELRAQLTTLLQEFDLLTQGGEALPDRLALLLAGLGKEQAAGTMPGRAMVERLTVLLNALRPDGGAWPEESVAVGRGQALLSAMAHLNQQVPAHHQPLFWLVPCFFAMGSGAGSWLLQMAAEEAEAAEPTYSLAFFLEMSRLGELQLQVTVRGETLQAAFFLASEEAAAHLRSELPELKERLAALGYQVGAISCQSTQTRLLEGLQKALTEAAGLVSTRLIDVKA